MATSEQSMNLTEAALAFAQELVECGEYPDLSTAVSEEMIKVRSARALEQVLHNAEFQHRRTDYRNTWEPYSVNDSFPAGDRAR